MSRGYIPFGVINKGKCNECTKMKPLDEMVRQDKGLYHCIDCEVDRLDYDGTPLSPEQQNITQVIEEGKIKKLLAWCFG